MPTVSKRRVVTCVKPEPPALAPNLIRWSVPGQIDSDVGEDDYLEDRSGTSDDHAGRQGKSDNSKEKHNKDAKNSSSDTEDDDFLQELAEQRRAKQEQEAKKEAEYKAQQATKNMGGRAAQMMRSATGVNVKKLTGFRLFVFNCLTHRAFDALIGAVIIANGATIGFEAQQNASVPLGCTGDCICHDPAIQALCRKPPIWLEIVDYIFLAIYIIELTMRFIVLRLGALADNWVKFDFIIVLVALVEIIVLMLAESAAFLAQIQMLKILRLVRLARAVRLMVQFQVLWQLVQGLVVCANVLVWTAILAGMILFMFALVGMEFISYDLDLGHNHPYNEAQLSYFFGLPDAMLTILQYMCFDSIASIHRPIMHHFFPTFFYFMTVQLVVSVALMNFVTGVMIDTAMAVAAEDKEVHAAMDKERKKEQLVELKKMFAELDEDGSGELSLDELIGAPEEALEKLIDIADTDDITGLFDLLDYDGGGNVDTDEFCDGVMQSTGGGAPLEMTKMIKQCSDILKNSKKSLCILNGEDVEQEEVEEDEEGEEDEEEKPPPPPPDPKTRTRNPKIVRLEQRCDKIAERIGTMQDSVNELLIAFMKLGTPLFAVNKSVAMNRGSRPLSAFQVRPQTTS